MDLSTEEAEQLQQLEQQLLQADTRHSIDKLSRLLADEFQEFGSSGRIYNKAQTIKALSQTGETARMQMSEFRTQRLAQNLVLVTYRIHKSNGSELNTDSLHSSIWRLTKNGWRILFHQATPTTLVQ